MSTCTATRIVPPPVPQPPRKVVLEMDERSAQTLRMIFRLIGGDPRHTRRGDVERISDALDSIGIKVPEDWDKGRGYVSQADGFIQGIYFIK